MLAEKTGVALQSKEDGDKTDSLLRVNKEAIAFYVNILDSEEGKFAQNYLTLRGIDRATALMFQLGFSPKGGTITIKVSESNTAVTIVVLDEGPGIPPHVSSKLFTRFFSVARPDTGRRGTGLGLRFVRKIMQLHGGEITIKNRLLQVGTEAKLRFPLG